MCTRTDAEKLPLERGRNKKAWELREFAGGAWAQLFRGRRGLNKKISMVGSQRGEPTSSMR